jgi:hypothetical protein
LVDPGAKLLTIDDKAELGSPAGEQPTETRVKPTHDRSGSAALNQLSEALRLL